MGLASSACMRRFTAGAAALAAIAAHRGSRRRAGAAAKPPTTFNPVVEAQNFSITQQRQAIYDTPQYQAQLAADSAASTAQALAAAGRRPGTLLHRRPVLEPGQRLRRRHPPQRLGRRRRTGSSARCCSPRATAPRSRATSGRRSPARPSGRGSSSPTARSRPTSSCTGTPPRPWPRTATSCSPSTPRARASQTPSARRPTRARASPPRPTAARSTTAPRTRSTSCSPRPSTRTSRCRAAAPAPATPPSRTSASPPASTPPTTRSGSCSTRREIGLVGHSYGAAGVSYIGQWDKRVKAIVALDNLGGPGPDAARCPAAAPRRRARSARPAAPRTPPIAPPSRSPSRRWASPPTTGCPPPPTPRCPTRRSRSPSRSPTPRPASTPGEIVIRGGSHLDFSFIPNQAFGASLRGPDITDWYLTAWFDRYLKDDAGRRRPAAHRALARRPRRGRRRPQPRRQRVLVLLLLAPGHRAGRAAVASTARTCATAARAWSRDRRRLERRLLLREDRHRARCRARAGGGGERALVAAVSGDGVSRSSARPCRPRGGRAAPAMAPAASVHDVGEVDLRVQPAGGHQVGQAPQVGGCRPRVLELVEDVEAVQLGARRAGEQLARRVADRLGDGGARS